MPSHNARKGLPPVRTIVILLCIAIAVILATVAWLNGLPTSNMHIEDLHATNHLWGPNYAYVDVTLYNNGTQSVRLKSITVNSQPATVVYIVGSSQISNGESVVLRVANTFVPGATYQLAFQTSKGNRFVYTATAELVSSIFKNGVGHSYGKRHIQAGLNCNKPIQAQ
jgi:hypothetical protein